MHILCDRGQCALAMSMRIRCVYMCGQMTERRLARVATHVHAFKCASVLVESVKLLFVVCNRMRGCIYARLGMCECVHVHTLIRYFPFPRFMRISKDLGRHYVRSRVCKRHTHGVSELRTCVCATTVDVVTAVVVEVAGRWWMVVVVAAFAVASSTSRARTHTNRIHIRQGITKHGHRHEYIVVCVA